MSYQDPLSPALLDELAFELEIRAEYPDTGSMIVPMHLMRRLSDALVWAGDEVAQLREDLIGSTGACVSLTRDNLRLEGQVTLLSTLLGGVKPPVVTVIDVNERVPA